MKKFKIKLLLFSFLLAHSIIANSFMLYGHRGARGLNPENTIPAYETALKIGVDYVDMDVALTKDKQVVVQHDLTLNPDITRDHLGKWIINKNIVVKNLTLKELQTFDVGQIKPGTAYAKLFAKQKSQLGIKIPTLASVIDYVLLHGGDKIRFQIEIKTDPEHPEWSVDPKEFSKIVAKIISEKNIVERTEIQAFDWRVLLELQKINPKIKTAYLTWKDEEKSMQDPDPKIAGLWTAGRLLKNYHGSIPQMVKAMGGVLWDPEDIQITKERVQEAHQLGLKVIAWSWTEHDTKDINLPMIKKLINLGVDGIITDRPDLVKN